MHPACDVHTYTGLQQLNTESETTLEAQKVEEFLKAQKRVLGLFPLFSEQIILVS